ncbi:MAG TPA: class I SAM-dependent methyltransferase [Candidatus Limnocylindrales bacterium]|nr:class I SAM-dependent methyltransferase [Candidatus Limnocylindrales bacterium]
MSPAEPRRFAILARLGVVPTTARLVTAALDEAIEAAGARARHGDGPGIAALDAGCGRVSHLKRYRSRIERLVGADIHEPAPGALPHLDSFATVDLCVDGDAFPPGTFDVVLSSFTVEHFADPAAAFRHLHGWLRPGGRLVLTTVNRRHPFVRAYLGLPDALRRRLQPLVKATVADAHPLVGACNDPAALAAALAAAGFEAIRVETVGHLARAWGRHWPTFAFGLVGDLLAQPFPSRRSTIVVGATAPAAPAAPAASPP